jgi:NAD(P)-dependent dehydrogenase (short-subunit alcohol dehydrogenase family)
MAARVLITGANGGIGTAIAAELLSRGYAVVATARRPESVSLAGCATCLQLDVTDDASVARAVSEAGQIDILINNAGVGAGGPTEHVPIESAKGLFDTNFFGTARMIRAFLPQMRRRRSGTIINVSSLSSQVPWPFGGYYGASKAAVESLSEALRMEVASLGVRVILVVPGIIDTAFGDRFVSFGDDSSDYEVLRSAWTRQFEGSHEEPEAVAVAIADSLEDDRAFRVVVGEDAIELVGLKRALDAEEFDDTFRRRFGLPLFDSAQRIQQ